MTFYLIPNGKDDDHEDVLNVQLNNFETHVGDNYPERVKDVGDYTMKLKDQDGNVVLNMTDLTLKIGANYQFLLQYDDDGTDPLQSQLILVNTYK